MDMVPSLCRSNLPSGELHVVRLLIMDADFTNHFSVVLDRRKAPLWNEHRLRSRPEDFGEPKYTENHPSWVIRSLYSTTITSSSIYGQQNTRTCIISAPTARQVTLVTARIIVEWSHGNC